MAPLDRKNRRHLAPWFERGGAQAAFLNACISGHLERARGLLDEDPRLANIPSGEVTPIRLAAFYGYTELAELLIRYGAAINTTASARLDYPLHVAAKSGHSNVVRVLIDHGAEVDALDTSDETPLHRAANMNHNEAIRLLIEAGQTPRSASGFGKARHYSLRFLLGIGKLSANWCSFGPM